MKPVSIRSSQEYIRIETYTGPPRPILLPFQEPQHRRPPQRPKGMDTILNIRRRIRRLTRYPRRNIWPIIIDPTLIRLHQIRRRIIKRRHNRRLIQVRTFIQRINGVITWRLKSIVGFFIQSVQRWWHARLLTIAVFVFLAGFDRIPTRGVFEVLVSLQPQVSYSNHDSS